MPKTTTPRRERLISYCRDDRQRNISVSVPTNRAAPVEVLLHPEWTSSEEPTAQAIITRSRWAVLRPVWESEARSRLRADGFEPGSGMRTPVDAFATFDYAVGKELLLLAWASEGCDADGTRRVVEAWRRLMPCEQSWMATKCVRPLGQPEDGPWMAWRRAWQAALGGDGAQAVAA